MIPKFTQPKTFLKRLATISCLVVFVSMNPTIIFAGTEMSIEPESTPPLGGLCDGVMIDDGDPCTIDECDPLTGNVTHTGSNFNPGVTLINGVPCYGELATVLVSATGGVQPYNGTGINFLAEGLHVILVSDVAGCSASVPINISQPPKLTADVTTTSTLCGLTSGEASVLVDGGTPGYSFIWRDSANNIVSFFPVASGLAQGTYTVTVTDLNGCTATASGVVAVAGNPPAAPGPISGPQGVCKGQSGIVYCVPADPTVSSYVWTLPNGATGSSTGNCITVKFSTKYSGGMICVYGVNSCGNSPTTCISAPLVTSKPPKPGPINGSSPVCAGNLYSYCLQPMASASSYEWVIGGNSGASILLGQGSFCILVLVPANATGSFVVKVKARNCKGLSDEVKLSVPVQNIPTVPSTISGPASVCKSQLGFYSVTNVSGNTYNWSVTGDVWIAGGQGSNNLALDYSTSTANSAVISVTATNGCGTSAPRNKTIAINPNCKVANYAGNISDTNSIELSIYPNPSHYEINIDFYTLLESKCQINIYDVTGRTLKEIELNSVTGLNHQLINISEFSKGTYFIRIASEEGLSISKFVVE